MRSKSKTSTEILGERDALHERVRALEAALLVVNDEIEHALRHPEGHFLALCRIGTVVRRAVPDSIPSTRDEAPKPPLSKTRPIGEASRQAS